MQAFVSCDGEAIILEEVMTDEMLLKLQQKNIAMGKIAASCSGILQPSDVSPLFRACKQVLKRITAMEEDVSNPVLESHLRNAITSLEAQFGICLGNEEKHKIICACMTIVYVLQDVLRPRLIKEGFEWCGQYPLNFDRLLNQCYKTITFEEREHLFARTEIDVQCFLENGYLNENDLTASGVSYDGSRDEKPLQNQRAVLLTNPKTLQRYQNKVNCGLPLNNIITSNTDKMARKKLKRAAQIVAAHVKRVDKKENEKKRKESMSVEDLQREKDENKVKRQLKKAKYDEELKSAQSLLSIV